MTSAFLLALLVQTAAAGPDAQAIQARMAKVYADTAFYWDEGTIASTTNDGHRPARSRTSKFRTVFTRTGVFRFEVDLQPSGEVGASRDVVWRTGAEMRRRVSGRDQDTVLRDLGSLIQAAAFASGLPTGFHALALLLPDVDYPGKSRKPFQRIADGRQDGRACYRLQVRDSTAGEFQRTLWIDKATFHLVRLDEVSSIDMVHGPELSTEIRIVYRPRFTRPVRTAQSTP